MEVGVEVGPPGVLVGVGVFVEPPGALVGVAVIDDCVDVAVGEDVTVGVPVLPRIVKVSVTNGISVSVLLPCETRALHSIAVCPACKPITWKVNAAPLVVALLLSLAAMATIKLCAPGPLIADAGSAPKSEPI